MHDRLVGQGSPIGRTCRTRRTHLRRTDPGFPADRHLRARHRGPCLPRVRPDRLRRRAGRRGQRGASPGAADDHRRSQPGGRLSARTMGTRRARRGTTRRGRVRGADPWRRRPRVARDAARRRGLVGGCLVRRRVRYLAIDRRRAHGARDARARDGRLAVPPRPGPDGLRGRQREPVHRGGDVGRARAVRAAGEGASILLLQQWEHDAIAWEALPVTSQEAIIGRRKSDSQELDPRPPTSHVTRTDQDRFGKIFRGTSPTGPCRSTGRSSSASAGARDRSSRCSKAWSAPIRATRSTDERRPCGTGAYYVIPTADRLAALVGGTAVVTAGSARLLDDVKQA